jgi:hypothetical protein
MKFFAKASILGAAACALISCVEINTGIGGDLVPVDSRYKVYSVEIPLDEVDMRMADSLSGYSQSRITIGAIKDDTFGTTARESAVTIVPLYDTLNFGNVQKVNYFTMTAAFDTTSVSAEGNERILQRVYVTELESGIDYTKLTDANDCAGLIKHGTGSIVKGTPIIDGADDLTLNFTDDFAWKLINGTNGLVLSSEMDKYFEAVPGLYIYTDKPSYEGGRINTFDVQMNYNSSSYYLESNYGELNITSIFDEEVGAVDTSFFFYYGATQFTQLDTLITEYSNGSFPQYAFNVTRHETRPLAGKATDKVYVEGGAGLKPVIPALSLKHLAEKAIQDTLLAQGRSSADYTKAIINKASLVLPFSMDTPYTELDSHFPPRLSPTCRIWTDTTSTFMGLTDASMEDENMGDINRSICEYSPDITYHLQQILLKDEDEDEGFKTGNYDIWMLLMSEQTTTSSSSSSSSSDYSEYLQYLAYQSYYNSMYGSSSYGYGSSYYSNYYSYLLAAMYASGSSSTTSTEYALDKDAYFKAVLYGPESADRQPSLKLVFSIPEE